MIKNLLKPGLPSSVTPPEPQRIGLTGEYISGSYDLTAATWFDITPNGNNGTGAIPAFSLFDGVVDEVNAASAWPGVETTISGEAWVRLNGAPGSDRAILGSFRNACLIVDAAGNLIWYDFGDPSAVNWIRYNASGAPLTPGVWYHVAFTADNLGFQASTGTAKVYINGVQTLSVPSGYFGVTVGFHIGGLGGFWFQKGNIDEVRIYPGRVLTPEEVEANYRAGVGGAHT